MFLICVDWWDGGIFLYVLCMLLYVFSSVCNFCVMSVICMMLYMECVDMWVYVGCLHVICLGVSDMMCVNVGMYVYVWL